MDIGLDALGSVLNIFLFKRIVEVIAMPRTRRLFSKVSMKSLTFWGTLRRSTKLLPVFSSPSDSNNIWKAQVVVLAHRNRRSWRIGERCDEELQSARLERDAVLVDDEVGPLLGLVDGSACLSVRLPSGPCRAFMIGISTSRCRLLFAISFATTPSTDASRAPPSDTSRAAASKHMAAACAIDDTISQPAAVAHEPRHTATRIVVYPTVCVSLARKCGL